MPPEKQIVIETRSRNVQFVRASQDLGRLLLRPEVVDIVSSFGSSVGKHPALASIDIVPPIPKKKLPQLGKALVNLATELDPNPPQAEYKII